MQIKRLMGINIYNFKTKKSLQLFERYRYYKEEQLFSLGKGTVTRNTEVKYDIISEISRNFFPSHKKIIRSKQ